MAAVGPSARANFELKIHNFFLSYVCFSLQKQNKLSGTAIDIGKGGRERGELVPSGDDFCGDRTEGYEGLGFF